MRGFFLLILLALTLPGIGQTPQVPGRMEFGGIKLIIDDPARREIQESVDALTANPKYFNVHVQRARSYFPIIERVFKEEGLPLDFKYLVLQESALLPDAVSSSDAVGFWQFKDFTAMEMGLRVDRSIDERMNIVSSSRGAARYLKKNNTRFFDNWIITLMAYQMGPGAAIKAGGEKYKGQKTMTIDRRTYWYIKKFLAHKVAFESFVNGPAELKFQEIAGKPGQSMDDIAKETGKYTGAQLSDYNKWLRRGKIPDDKSYTVLLPIAEGSQPMVLAAPVESNRNTPVASTPTRATPTRSSGTTRNYDIADPTTFPLFDNRKAAFTGAITEINGRPAVIARLNDRVATLAGRGGISVSKFLRINDMIAGEKIKEGKIYYLKKKQSKPRAYYHVAGQGEDLWDISQKYGVKLDKLKQRNRIRSSSNRIEEGRIVWMRYIRPSDVPIEYEKPVKNNSLPVLVTKKESVPEKKTTVNVSEEDKPIATERTVEKREWNATPEAGEKTASTKAPTGENEASGQPATVNETEEIASEAGAIDGPHKRIIHQVKSGETFYSISREYEVSIQDLLAWNNASINDPLAIDQELIVKKPTTQPIEASEPENTDAGDTYYVVKNGDTLYGIARKFNLSLNDLKKLNNKSEDVIKPGEKLKVSK